MQSIPGVRSAFQEHPDRIGGIEFLQQLLEAIPRPAIIQLQGPECVLGYAYARLYRVSVDPRGLTVRSLLGAQLVLFSEIAAIATMRGRGIDYWFFSSTGACIAKIGGSVENFESLQFDVESAVQSRRVILYDCDRMSGWRERTNDPNDDWKKSEGPGLIAARNRRVNVEMIVGAVLVALVFIYVHYYPPQ